MAADSYPEPPNQFDEVNLRKKHRNTSYIHQGIRLQKAITIHYMKTTPIISAYNFHRQCIIDCRMIKNGSPPIQSRMLKAIIDTGSYYNFVTKSFINEDIVIKENEVAEYSNLGESTEKGELYSCKLLIPALSPNGFDFTFVKWEKIFPPIDIIIGTSFLRSFILKYNYPNTGQFYLDVNKEALK